MALTKEIINYVDSTIKRFITTSMNRVVQEAHTHPNKPLLDTLTSAGTGTLYLADDGTYKPVAGGTGTVTSIDVDAGTGISVSPAGPITTSGTFTVTNTAPDQIVALTAGTGIGITGTYPNFTITNSSPSSGGTVTSVSALTLGTTGTDLSSTVANGTTTPVITLNVPTASATNRGALSSSDWTTFNNKQNALVSGTNIRTINGNSLLGSGNLIVNPPIFTIELINYSTATFYCPFNLKIDSITNLVGTPTITITAGGSVYTIGSNVTINQGSTIVVTSNISSVINLNCTQV